MDWPTMQNLIWPHIVNKSVIGLLEWLIAMERCTKGGWTKWRKVRMANSKMDEMEKKINSPFGLKIFAMSFPIRHYNFCHSVFWRVVHNITPCRF